jgi:hypothetical protein
MRHAVDLLVACEIDIADEAKNMQRPDKRAKVQAAFQPMLDDENYTDEQIEVFKRTNPFYRRGLKLSTVVARVEKTTQWMLEFSNNPAKHTETEEVEQRAIVRTSWPWMETNTKATRDTVSQAVVFEVALMQDYRPRLLKKHLGLLRNLILEATQPFVKESIKFTTDKNGTMVQTLGTFWSFWDKLEVDPAVLPDIKSVINLDKREHSEELLRQANDEEAIKKVIASVERMAISKASRPSKKPNDQVSYEVHEALSALALVRLPLCIT